ncbi:MULTISPECIES: accessory Sec system translocase SecA2 [Geobacillus]|jgi:preprotein translocase subunit SecA|uniref:Protein translocase subunit SecA 2 n=1 Tax=Geobacillus thermodenitrificans (strain NG80-2) TaxID=420246 RepID=SECA2_GEOTN|nr:MULTISPECIES: accessory Sec system translocase SecA2 [Geobacillus]A4ISX2.1 RecName: Full=Protein translocase subunit SecA 2 [Geobacillus thermodenitrificans NG80-2]ABO68426.1 Preprotein translocase SecA subunit [Geobacillus thermodenitrificans NG80-2]ARA98457.1 accessory Sec system translocase SecA2 [Geobacillus thermodenitrificans]ATO37836.1 accessory Sec system translocase SecA2 [Geobacillus thermodenitrificans]KQB92072.1 Protein translocase subunit SecA 2 [Geobacillus sp. PA-3]NNU86217.
MLSLLKRAIGYTNERQLKKYMRVVEQINRMEPQMEKLTDAELRRKTDEFKEQLASGKSVNDIQVEAFAVVREVAKRVLGMRHFDVQLIGGLVLAEGNIAEMATGEGKTLVASLPSYLRALEGKGVHVITANDYLAKRDRNLIGQIHEFLGLTVGLNLPLMSPQEKKQAYQADITYGIGTEFGFDYLRDHMVYDASDKVQRPYHYAIIDEIDSVLIDEAKTPLIIAGKTRSSTELHYIAARLVKRFEREVDYIYDGETKTVNLTDEGIEKVEKAFGIDNLYDAEHQVLYHYVIQALRAHVLFQRDVDYIIRDGKVLLVDAFTGRVMEGRSLSDGLHQAIEAKEGLEITEENKTYASITIQNYFRMYPILSGMTGTAKTEEKEFQRIYGIDVIPIPTNRPKIRVDLPDRVYMTRHDKYVAVAKEVKRRHESGQPVLIGTTSILQSEEVAKYLDQEQVPYELLNAKTVEQEAEVIARAGQRGRVTIATNIAGRGTDILLGEGVNELGGLHVLGTERHESRRIDNQLKGRAGRQGDPGSSQFFISLEDDMFRRFAAEETEKLKAKLKTDETGCILNNDIHEFVDKVQRIVEGMNFSVREYNLKLDDVMNEQRNVIYQIRDRVLEENDRVALVVPMIRSACDRIVDAYALSEQIPEEWDVRRMTEELNRIVYRTPITFDQPPADLEDVKRKVAEAVESYVALLEKKKAHTQLQTLLKSVMLTVIDDYWMRHLDQMALLKEGIGLRHYQQEDPIRLYQKEGFEMFKAMYEVIEKEISVHTARLLQSLEQEEGQS